MKKGSGAECSIYLLVTMANTPATKSRTMRHISFLLISALLIITNSCDDDDDNGNGNQDESAQLNLVAEGFNAPIFLVESPDNSGRLFVVDQSGQIYIIKDGSKLSEPFLDIRDKIILEEEQDERGLLGLAFHPDYASNGLFFVYYAGPLRSTAPSGWDHTNFVAGYKVSADADRADPASERIVLAMDHPQANHNAGTVAFGPDGYLYISVGDGGGGDDNQLGHVEDWYTENSGGNGQDITQNLLGSILRIDVNPTEGYAIPPDNPFVDKEGLDEIYAYGLRNPYRFSFAPDNMMILADAGQELYEEIDVIEKGGNYGWNVKEGRHCFDTDDPETPPGSCPSEDPASTPLIDPVIEFANSRNSSDGLGTVSVGGYVYDGAELPSLNGKYIFGVLTQDPQGMNGAVFAADRSGNDWSYQKLAIGEAPDNGIGAFLLGFGQDNSGEVYVLTSGGTQNSGKVYKLGGPEDTDPKVN
jgi:glucose/arabinose dehydrogenase